MSVFIPWEIHKVRDGQFFKILQGLGAELVLTPAQEGMEGAISQAQLLCDKIPGSFMPQQFRNPAMEATHSIQEGSGRSRPHLLDHSR